MTESKVFHPVYLWFDSFPGGPEGPFIDTLPASDDSRVWTENPLGGGWEVSASYWRLGPFIPVADVAALLRTIREIPIDPAITSNVTQAVSMMYDALGDALTELTE